MIEISREEAQQYIANIQLLTNGGKAKSILDIAKRIHNIQIDTISVVARSHDLTIFNRLPNYVEKDVWKEIEQKRLFEYWSHAICIIPIEEYPFYLWKMKFKEKNPENWWKKWGAENKDLIKKMLNYVRKNGPTSSSEFKRERKVEGWWDWKKEKMALEYLFNEGKLMVAYRKGFKKHYDLPENVLPNNISTEPYPKDNLANRMIEIIFSSLGIASLEELKSFMGRAYMGLLWKNNKKKMAEFLVECVENDLLNEVKIPEVQQPHYVLSNMVKDLEKTISFETVNQPMKFLSPFDNLVRERDYPKRLWGFDYKIECYTPQTQRIYGYFSLPILDGSQIIGRTDLKVHRKKGKLEIKSLHFESGIKLNEELLYRFKEGLQNFATFHSCQEIIMESMQPIKHKGKIKALFFE